MSKRSTTNYSFVIGVDKPAGMSSHDVVSRVRRVFGERRVGHMGTLDPAATGALAVCVGPATRLNPFMTAHDKTYEFTIVFGSATDTDDAEGKVIRTADIPADVYDFDFAIAQMEKIVGPCKQMPPIYSAIKVNGRKSYEAARSGKSVDLTPRDVEIYATRVLGVETVNEVAVWHVAAFVSSGTYVRSIARDMGESLGTCAHVGQLRRLQAGNLTVENCVSIEALESDPFACLLDPVKLLGFRFVFANEKQAEDVSVGRFLYVKDVPLYRYDQSFARGCSFDSCTSGIVESFDPLTKGELVCIIADNTLKAIYQYDSDRNVLKSRCGFAIGVKRGSDIQY